VKTYITLILCFALIGDLFARAGGGGSYRSSSGSSSRSSSSSSSRSSSSSSSRPSSSSSSYRPSSSSSSSSYRPSSSSSSSTYRPSGSAGTAGASSHRRAAASGYAADPIYTELISANSVERVYQFGSNGRITLSEKILIPAKTAKDARFVYTPPTPEGPWEIETVRYLSPNVKNLELSALRLSFLPLIKQPADFTLQYSAGIAASPIPTEYGSYIDIPSRCFAHQCKMRFSALPAGSRVEAWSHIWHKNSARNLPKLLITRGAPEAEFTGEELHGADMLRVILAGEAAHQSALDAWKVSDIVTTADYRFQITPDGLVHAHLTTEGKNRFFRPTMPIAYDYSITREPLIGRTKNIERGWLYGEPHVLAKNWAKDVRYSLLGAMYRKNDSYKLTLSAPAIQFRNTDSTAPQTERKFINTYKPIRIELPAGATATASVEDCMSLYGENCQATRPIMASVKQVGSTLVITPHEAQVSGIWLVNLDIRNVEFKEPALTDKISFGFAHYHKFGDNPRWVFWVYLISIFTLLTLIIVFIRWRARTKHLRAEQRRLDEQEKQAIAALLQHDPKFDLAAFKERGRTIATLIQQAWCAGDMRSCRRFLSQGVYNRFRLQLKIMRELEKRQNAMADFKIERFFVSERRRSGEFEALIVRLDAGARDVTVAADLSETEAWAQALKAPFQRFTEYYTFMRRRKAITTQKESVDACARCGTPFAPEGETNKCSSCGTIAGSGSFDWVLAEITQESEYARNAPRAKTGNSVSADRIEDRASFVFWRDLMAKLTGNRAYIQRDASDRYLKNNQQRENLQEIAVGAAELEGYDDSKSPIMARVRIKWSARAGKDREIRHRQSVLALVAEPKYEEHREPNAKDNSDSIFRIVAGPETDEVSGFAEHSCPSCGAPLPETDSETCSYCQSTIARRNKDWLLEAIHTTVE